MLTLLEELTQNRAAAKHGGPVLILAGGELGRRVIRFPNGAAPSPARIRRGHLAVHLHKQTAEEMPPRFGFAASRGSFLRRTAVQRFTRCVRACFVAEESCDCALCDTQMMKDQLAAVSSWPTWKIDDEALTPRNVLKPHTMRKNHATRRSAAKRLTRTVAVSPNRSGRLVIKQRHLIR